MEDGTKNLHCLLCRFAGGDRLVYVRERRGELGHRHQPRTIRKQTACTAFWRSEPKNVKDVCGDTSS
jgi:hypothetical protein